MERLTSKLSSVNRRVKGQGVDAEYRVSLARLTMDAYVNARAYKSSRSVVYVAFVYTGGSVYRAFKRTTVSRSNWYGFPVQHLDCPL